MNGVNRRLMVFGAVAALLMVPAATAVDAHAPVTPVLANPGFEADGAAGVTPAGWHNFGTPGAAVTLAYGHTGSFSLTQYSATAFNVTTTQRVEHLTPGWYTLSAWTERSTGQNNSYIQLAGCSLGNDKTYLPISSTPNGNWLQITFSTFVNGRDCTIVLHTDAAAGEWSGFDDIALVPGASRLSVLGADVSSLKKSEDLGGVYLTSFGKPGDALDILKNHGLNWIRLRVFVNPADGYHGTAELLTMAKRAQKLGLKVLVDFHFSDFWADPGKQWLPEAWATNPPLTFAQLQGTYVDYIKGVMNALKAQHTPPAMVQLGNEIQSGMLWDYAASWTGQSCADDGFGHNPTTYTCINHTENFDNLASLLTVGSNAVKSIFPSTRIMLQLADGGSNGTYQWWFGNITARNVPFDVIGVSYYEYWHGPLTALQYNLNDITSRYNKDAIVVETAYPFTVAPGDSTPNSVDTPLLIPGYPATPAGQAANFRDIMSIIRAVPNGRGLGVFYWDATWTAVNGNGWSPRDPSSGNAWENQALFDYSNKPLPAMNDFRP
jgi:arabinogalactan endo-1,4-beta-galactosidase